MESRFDFAVVLLAGLAVGVALHTPSAAVGAQTRHPIADGVYTEEQARRGETVFTDTCAVCHGADLKGRDFVPTLTGSPFLESWKDKTAGDLFEKIRSTMPAVAPGTLTPEQSIDAVAYILSVAKYPAGAAELPAAVDELKQIRIEAPNP